MPLKRTLKVSAFACRMLSRLGETSMMEINALVLLLGVIAASFRAISRLQEIKPMNAVTKKSPLSILSFFITILFNGQLLFSVPHLIRIVIRIYRADPCQFRDIVQ